MSNREKRLLKIQTGADACAYIETSPEADCRWSGDHLTATNRQTGMRMTTARSHYEYQPHVRRDIIRAIIACGFTVLVISLVWVNYV